MFVFEDTRVFRTAQYIDNVTHAEMTIEFAYALQYYLGKFSGIVCFRWIKTDIAVATGFIQRFTKITEQYTASASQRFGECNHAVEFMDFNPALINIFDVFYQAAHQVYIARAIKHERLRLQTITTCSSGFLIIGFDAFG